MKTIALTLLALSALAAGCRHPETRDYQGVRDRSEQQHQSLDSQSK